MNSNPFFKQEPTGFSTEFLTNEIIMWGTARGIIKHSTSSAQASKTAEEVEELKEHVSQLKFLRSEVRGRFNAIKEHAVLTLGNSKSLDGFIDGTYYKMEELLLSKLVDDYGDIFVTLVMGAEIEGIDIRSCIASALNEIKDRKGEMRADGKFYKQELPPAFPG